MSPFYKIRPALYLMVEKPALYLIPVWILMQFIIYQKFGIKVVYDSKRYFAYIESLSSGTSFWLQPDSILYSSYTLFLYFFISILSLSVSSIVVMQVIIAGFATYCLYNLVLNLTLNKATAFISVALFIFWPDIHTWNYYIHTESLYTSITIIILYFLSIRSITVHKAICLVILLVIVLFLRPNGFFLVIATLGSALFDIISTYKPESYKVIILICIVLALLILISISKEALEIFSPLDYLKQGQIIQGYNLLTVSIKSEKLNQSSLVLTQIIQIIIAQPFAYLKLLFLRLLFFWGQIRPYYSAIHNFLILFYFLPIYIFALTAIKRIRYLHKAFTFMIIVTSLQTSMVMVISVDWDNRFIVPILPFTFIFAAIGLTTLLNSSNVSKGS